MLKEKTPSNVLIFGHNSLIVEKMKNETSEIISRQNFSFFCPNTINEAKQLIKTKKFSAVIIHKNEDLAKIKSLINLKKKYNNDALITVITSNKRHISKLKATGAELILNQIIEKTTKRNSNYDNIFTKDARYLFMKAWMLKNKN